MPGFKILGLDCAMFRAFDPGGRHVFKIVITGKPPHGNRNQSVYRLPFAWLMLMVRLFVVGWLVGWAC
jgi:hypothetical protein